MLNEQACPTPDAYYIALKQNHQYVKKKHAKNLSLPSPYQKVTEHYFAHVMMPALFFMAIALNDRKDEIINWEERRTGKTGLWNHGAHFDCCFTIIWDGYPLPVFKPQKWIDDDRIMCARYLQSGKYNCACFKAHVGIGFTGVIHALTGPHLGIDHDKRIYDDTTANFPKVLGEWHLGDLAYDGCHCVLTSRKQPSGEGQDAWDERDEWWKNFVAHYRSRVEIVIAKLKRHQWCQVTFRSDFNTLCAHFNVSNLMTAMEIKHNFEVNDTSMFEVVGPWPHDFS